MTNKYAAKLGGSLLLILLFVAFGKAQRIIPFRVASDDPTGKFSWSGWAVMGKFEGTIEISEEETRRRLRIKLTGGELLAPKSRWTVVSVTPFLAKKKGKGFDIVAFSNEMVIEKRMEVGVPFRLEPYDFQIRMRLKEDISKYWLAFRISHECPPYTSCAAYAHSAGDIFSR